MDDEDLDGLPPKSALAYGLTGKRDKPRREQPVAYDPTSRRHKTKLDQMADNPTEESNQLQYMSRTASAIANESNPQDQKLQSYDLLYTYDESAPEHNVRHDLIGKDGKPQLERIHSPSNESENPQYGQVLAYDSCFGLVIPPNHLARTTRSIS
jgi:hypothetical protein